MSAWHPVDPWTAAMEVVGVGAVVRSSGPSGGVALCFVPGARVVPAKGGSNYIVVRETRPAPLSPLAPDRPPILEIEEADAEAE